jgi:hypothetical protein
VLSFLCLTSRWWLVGSLHPPLQSQWLIRRTNGNYTNSRKVFCFVLLYSCVFHWHLLCLECSYFALLISFVHSQIVILIRSQFLVCFLFRLSFRFVLSLQVLAWHCWRLVRNNDRARFLRIFPVVSRRWSQIAVACFVDCRRSFCPALLLLRFIKQNYTHKLQNYNLCIWPLLLFCAICLECVII